MLFMLCVILLVLWIAGQATSNTFNGAIHALLVVALVLFLLGFFGFPDSGYIGYRHHRF